MRAILNTLRQAGAVRSLGKGLWELADAGKARVAELEAMKNE